MSVAMAADPLKMAACLVATATKAAVKGGASRHVAAAVTCAVVRTVWQLLAGMGPAAEASVDDGTSPYEFDSVQRELGARLCAVKPVMHGQILAAALGLGQGPCGLGQCSGAAKRRCARRLR